MFFFNWAAWSMMKSCTLKIEFQLFTERWLHQTILFYLNPWVCGLMVFRTTVKNISVILWWSGLNSHKMFEYEFCTRTWKIFNQNIISSKYSILIGQFWSMSIKLVLKSFMRSYICWCRGRSIVYLICT